MRRQHILSHKRDKIEIDDDDDNDVHFQANLFRFSLILKCARAQIDMIGSWISGQESGEVW